MTTPTGTFLTPAEIGELSGALRADLQIEWLQSRGWVFELTRSGHPVVLRAYAEKRLGLTTETRRRSAPNFAAVQNA